MRTSKDTAGNLALLAYGAAVTGLRVGIDGLNDQHEEGLHVNQVQEVEMFVAVIDAMKDLEGRLRDHLEFEQILSQIRLSPEAMEQLTETADEWWRDNDDWSRAA